MLGVDPSVFKDLQELTKQLNAALERKIEIKNNFINIELDKNMMVVPTTKEEKKESNKKAFRKSGKQP